VKGTVPEQAQVSTQEGQPKIQRRKIEMARQKTTTAEPVACERYPESTDSAVGERDCSPPLPALLEVWLQ
jgi:hypothetical protein